MRRRRPTRAWLARAGFAVVTAVLLASAWLGWHGAAAQGALDNLWSLCSVR